MSWRPLCLASYHGIDVPATPLRIRLMRGWLAWTTMTTIATSCNSQQEEPGDTETCAWLRQGFRVICRNLRHKVKHFAFAEVDLIPRRHLFFPFPQSMGFPLVSLTQRNRTYAELLYLKGDPCPTDNTTELSTRILFNCNMRAGRVSTLLKILLKYFDLPCQII